MPLVQTQHIVTAAGINRDEAIDALKKELEDLPPVRIVTLLPSTVPVSFLGRSVDTVSFLAVVEEV